MSDFFNPFGYRNDNKIEVLQSNLNNVGYCVDKKLVDGIWMTDLDQYSKLVNFAVKNALNEVKLSMANIKNTRTIPNKRCNRQAKCACG